MNKLIAIILLCFTFSAYSVAPNATMAYQEDGVVGRFIDWILGKAPASSPYFEDVYIDCRENACWLECHGTGWDICDWSTAFNDCRGCLGLKMTVALDADVDEMREHALTEIIVNDNLNGTYTSNIIQSDGDQYYRTVEWEADTTLDEFTMTITIGYYDPSL